MLNDYHSCEKIGIGESDYAALIAVGYNVYVDSDGMIRHGTKKDNNGSPVPAYPYYWSHKYNCWSNAPCTPSQLYHGNWSMK